MLHERLLSPRIIHFTKKQIYWECRENIACEGFSNLDHEAFHSYDLGSSRYGLQLTTLRTLQDEVRDGEVPPATWRQRFLVFWSILVEHYTECGLTEEKDKLIAVHGIVKEMERNIGDECFAGHWRSQLPASLCWGVPSGLRDEELKRNPPSQWRAPSWSWASVNLPIVHQIPTGKQQISKLQSVPAPRHINGDFISERIRLQGSVFVAERTSDCQSDPCSDPGYTPGSHLKIGQPGQVVVVCTATIYSDNHHTTITKFFLMPIAVA